MDLIQRTRFTDEKVDEFLVNKLHFSNWKIVLQRNRFEFLTCLQQKFSVHVYFQNIRMAAVPPESRAAPTLEQIIATGFSGRGGVCFELNYFLYLLLIAVGFDTFLVRSTYTGGMENSHLMPVVRMEQEELYMLDVASANPIDVPIPLHKLPHRRRAAGCWYEYRKHVLPGNETSTHGRYQIGGRLLFTNEPAAETPDAEVLRFEFDLVPRTLEFFHKPMHDNFTDTSGVLLRCPLLFRYIRLEGLDPEDSEFVLVLGRKVLVATKHERNVTECSNYDELVPVVWKYFPELDPEEMRKAFEAFGQFEK